MTTFVFRNDLAESLQYNGEWDEYYKAVWGSEVERIEEVRNITDQLHGIDRRIVLRSGQVITVDEKHIKINHNNILLELWSQFYGNYDPRNKRGWTLDWNKRCDYIAWCVISSNICRLIPYDALRRTTWRHMREWAQQQGRRWRKAVDNGSYQTINIAVQWDELYRCLRADAVESWGERKELDRLPSVTI